MTEPEPSHQPPVLGQLSGSKRHYITLRSWPHKDLNPPLTHGRLPPKCGKILSSHTGICKTNNNVFLSNYVNVKEKGPQACGRGMLQGGGACPKTLALDVPVVLLHTASFIPAQYITLTHPDTAQTSQFTPQKMSAFSHQFSPAVFQKLMSYQNTLWSHLQL